MRAACKLAAQVLDYAGTLVRVRNFKLQPSPPLSIKVFYYIKFKAQSEFRRLYTRISQNFGPMFPIIFENNFLSLLLDANILGSVYLTANTLAQS